VQINLERLSLLPPGFLITQSGSGPVSPLNHAGKVNRRSLQAAKVVCGVATASVAPPTPITNSDATIQFRSFFILIILLGKYSARNQEVQEQVHQGVGDN